MGLLYLQKDEWNNEPIVSEEWLNFDLPGEEMCFFAGFDGQRIMIFPEHELIIVRAGVTHKNSHESIGGEECASEIITVLRGE